MFVRPSLFHEYLDRACVIDQVYEAMGKDDLGEVVMTALDILKKTGNIPNFKQEGKSEIQSDIFRSAGNDHVSKGDFTSALECYNRALLWAPKNSRAMKLAYSNRSFVLLKVKAFRACVTDIDRCFSMGCPTDIKDKLLKRRDEANQYSLMETLALNSLKGFSRDYFNFTATRNSEVSSVSAKINFEVKGNEVRVTAATTIDTGTLISYEEAYMATVSHENRYVSCYYCLKLLPNLIPCDTCCYALFCSEECKSECYKDYHKYECKMMGIVNEICHGPIPNLLIKSLLKLKTKTDSWKELIKASKKLGNERIKSFPVKELIDYTSEYSILSFSENRAFVHGIMYNASFVCAALLHYLSEIPSFLPSTDREEAVRAMARIMMYLSIYGPPNYVIQSVNEMRSERTGVQQMPSFAWYTFYGNLKTSCKPNVMVSFLHNKAALIAMRKINPGDEIIASCLETSVELDNHFRNVQTFLLRGSVCICPKCNGIGGRDILSPSQQECFRNINILSLQGKFDVVYAKEIFDKVVKVMDVLSDVPNSREFLQCYVLFRKCVLFFEAVETVNGIIR